MPRVNKWYKLDNAAKPIPSTSRGSDSRVFRLVCELKEEVDPKILQQALNCAIKEFPHFNCIMKKGLFWYYMEAVREPALVREDDLPALTPLYVSGRHNLLYRVTYYKRRINLEMYHAVSDGTGAFQFLKKIVTEYLVEKYQIPEEKLEESRASLTEKSGDAFNHFYTGNKQKLSRNIRAVKRKAYQLKGERDENLNLHILEGCVSVQAFLEIARTYRTTLGILTTAIMIEAIVLGMSSRERKFPVVVTVPVNLRNYYRSETTRNFYGAISIVYEPGYYDGTLESIIPVVEDSFKNQLTEENLELTMNTYAALEHNWAIRIIPLQIKDLGISGANYFRVKEMTTSVSNVGVVRLQKELAEHIDRFASFMSTRNAQLCISSFEDQLVFGFTSAFRRHDVIMRFFRRLTDLGMKVELASNDYDL